MSDSTRHDADGADDRADAADARRLGDTDENPTLPTRRLNSDTSSGWSDLDLPDQDADTARLGTAPLVTPSETPAGTPADGTAPVWGTPSAGTSGAATGPADAPAPPATPMDALFGTDSAVDAGAPARPRVRSGAIAWGLLVILASAALIALTTVPAAATWFTTWANSLTPAGFAVVGVVVVGALVLLLAGLSAIRGAQRRSAERQR